MTGGELLLLAFIAAGLWWLTRNVRQEQWIERVAQTGTQQVERFLQAEAEGLR